MPISRLGPVYDANRNTGKPIMSFIYIGFVKGNTDVQRMGRLSVWIPEIGGSEKDPASWITVSYASPFAGATDLVNLKENSTKEDESQKSYGWWAVPPDINNEVAVFFANGDITRGYWFACLFQQYMNHMVPGVAVDLSTDGGNKAVPVVEYNKFQTGSFNPASPRRPTFSALTNGLKTEGLEDDFERGSASTSARREAPSQVFGLVTPRANTIHIDDNHDHRTDNRDTQEKSTNEFIRLRTRSGTQVLIHETTGYVYINSKNGDAWLEISDAGSVDIFTTNSVSIRAKKDFNVRADGSIILDAGKDINIRAGNDVTIESKRDKQVKVGRNYNISVAKDKGVTTGGNLNMQSGKDYNAKSNQNMHLESKNDSTMKAGGTHKRDGKSILDNGGGAGGAAGPGGSGGSAGGKGPAEYDKLVGTYVGVNEECASLTKQLTGVGPTSTWSKGDNVLAARPPIGTAIASGWTGDGAYPQGNAAYGDGTKGSGGHTAVVTGYTDNGFTVLEQYNGSNGAQYRTYTAGGSGFFNANNWYTVKA